MKTYAEIGAEIGQLVTTKQQAYGDSFGKAGEVMRILYPDGIGPEKLDDALTIVRVLDKLFRIATDRDALGESPWRDIAGYSLLSVKRVEASRAPTTQELTEAQMDAAVAKTQAAHAEHVAEHMKLYQFLVGGKYEYPISIPPDVAPGADTPARYEDCGIDPAGCSCVNNE